MNKIKKRPKFLLGSLFIFFIYIVFSSLLGITEAADYLKEGIGAAAFCSIFLYIFLVKKCDIISNYKKIALLTGLIIFMIIATGVFGKILYRDSDEAIAIRNIATALNESSKPEEKLNSLLGELNYAFQNSDINTCRDIFFENCILFLEKTQDLINEIELIHITSLQSLVDTLGQMDNQSRKNVIDTYKKHNLNLDALNLFIEQSRIFYEAKRDLSLSRVRYYESVINNDSLEDKNQLKVNLDQSDLNYQEIFERVIDLENQLYLEGRNQ